MTEDRFIERDPAGHYRLGRKLLGLGSRVDAQTGLIQLAQPIMARLRDQLGETLNLTAREGDEDEVVHVEKPPPTG